MLHPFFLKFPAIKKARAFDPAKQTQRKIIFTNSDRKHAVKALDRLGVRDCFEQIICFETMNPNLPSSTRPNEFPVVLKPSMEAMEIALRVAEVDPRRTLFLDDHIRNVAFLGLEVVIAGADQQEAHHLGFSSSHHHGNIIPIS
ncbi:hypothetical protein PRUPE_8G033000 [Prunus persica]|uniref:FCP1 homology domain-containing protein n=1 Tax=Prunus persica TaxID=3760 RepID=A0A251MS95_PRUPE|nr:hypothetical protein PRUPE_8G033000 [Prunus persica]